MSSDLPDFERFLQPLGGEAPCGPEIDYDSDFIELERAIAGTPERQYGETIIAAEAADFARVLNQASSLMQRSRDLRLAVMITRALTRTRGAHGARHGLSLIESLLDVFGEALHPRLEIDGERDPLPRANALAVLAVSEGLLGDLRELKLPTRLMGTFELAELERSAAGREGAPLGRQQLNQLLQDEQLAGNPELEALKRLHESLQRLQQRLRDELGVENAPDLRPLIALTASLSLPEANAPEASSSAEASAGTRETSAIADGLPALRTRQDAIRILEEVCRFLETHEPANPAPLLIRRARGMIGQDFLSILRDFAPDGVAQAEHLAGLRS
ncbi:MAG: type VI secretion system protein TssA [Xanthomonadales bacterium]|nr:type VI secretion system protein TssA [Xanthomonadales bacterium]